MVFVLYRVGSSMLIRHMKTATAGMTPRPRERRQTARRWSSPKLRQQNELRSVASTLSWNVHPKEDQRNECCNNEAKVNHGVCTLIKITRVGRVSRNLLVARANHLFCAFLAMPSSSDCSEAATDPDGYSAPIPIPRKNLSCLQFANGLLKYVAHTALR